MLEALILWQVAGARQDARRERNRQRPEGQGMYEFLVFLSFVITFIAWPIPVMNRLGLWKRSKTASYIVGLLMFVFIGIGLPVVYLFIGFFWACFELAMWMGKQQTT
jgi:hypothetical protein